MSKGCCRVLTKEGAAVREGTTTTSSSLLLLLNLLLLLLFYVVYTAHTTTTTMHPRPHLVSSAVICGTAIIPSVVVTNGVDHPDDCSSSYSDGTDTLLCTFILGPTTSPIYYYCLSWCPLFETPTFSHPPTKMQKFSQTPKINTFTPNQETKQLKQKTKPCYYEY